MARLLDEIDWASPVFPLPQDVVWATEIEKTLGRKADCYMYAAPSPWLRRGLMDTARFQYAQIGSEMAWLAILVTSQENACRYCYGAARQYLRLLGLDKKKIDAVEREAQMAGADEKEQAVLRFCRNLSRSNPRPARSEVAALEDLGFSHAAVAEISLAVVAAAFTNRFATFIAAPLLDNETGDGIPFWQRTGFFFFKRKYPLRLPPTPPAEPQGPYSGLIAMLEGTEGGPILQELLTGAFSSPHVPRRTAGWIFAVIADALDCELCTTGSRKVLAEEGFSEAQIDNGLQNLAGEGLTETETILLPWVRETVHYDTEAIQRHTHLLAKKMEAPVLLDAIGIASLANSCARLSMLQQ